MWAYFSSSHCLNKCVVKLIDKNYNAPMTSFIIDQCLFGSKPRPSQGSGIERHNPICQSVMYNSTCEGESITLVESNLSSKSDRLECNFFLYYQTLSGWNKITIFSNKCYFYQSLFTCFHQNEHKFWGKRKYTLCTNICLMLI